MLRKLIHFIAYRRHPWREMQFDELAEIYTSMSLRSFGFGLIGIFVPVYLYTSGVSLKGILLFMTLFFMLRIPLSVYAGYIVGRIGPKHTIALSTVIMMVFLGMLLLYDHIGWPLFALAFVFSASNSAFFIAYHTDFSKVKDSKHGGKELGWLYIFERLGGTLGPVVGGLLGSIFVPQATLGFAIFVLMTSLIPLFLTKEPIKTHQRVTYKGFDPRKHTRDFVALASFGVQNVATAWLWPLLIAVFIFTDGTYAKVGAVVGLTTAISLISAKMYGAFIDAKKGLHLLRYGVFMSFVLNFAKAAAASAGGAVAASAFGEPIALAYRMPLAKGMYDAADGQDNYRIVYLVWSEIYDAVFKIIYCGALLLAFHFYDPVSTIRVSYIVVPFVGLLMLLQEFPALKESKSFLKKRV